VDEVNREWISSELRSLLQALASTGEVALAYASEGSCRPDELALAYDNFVHAFVGNFGAGLSARQRSSLLRVHELFRAMSDTDQPELWTDDAVRWHPRWSEVRVAVKDALDALSWTAG